MQLSQEERYGILESRLTCVRGMLEQLTYLIQEENEKETPDTKLIAEAEQGFLDYSLVAIALENEKETMLE